MNHALLIPVLIAFGLACQCVAEEPSMRGDLLLVQGTAGEEEFETLFDNWCSRWVDAAKRGNFRTAHIKPTPKDDDQKRQVLEKLKEFSDEKVMPLWIVMIGHGTFDGRSAKFNLAGSDLTAVELDQALANIARPTVVINCSSSSAPFLEQLSRENRIVLTSTRSGEQINFSRFGEYFSLAIGSVDADLDKDRQTSLLEAFLSASRKTLEFYEADGRIPTENALIDDNGDGKGTRATAFRGVRVIATPADEGTLLDGFRAHQVHLIPSQAAQALTPEQRSQRDEIETQIELLRLKKKSLPEEEYYDRLEVLLLKLADVVLGPLPENETTGTNADPQGREEAQPE